MRGTILFAWSRRWLLTIFVSTASAVLVLACGPLSYTLNPRGGFNIVAAAQIPVIAAICIQASLGSPLRRSEALAARRVGRWRVLHVVVLTVLAASLLGVAASFLDPSRMGLNHGATFVGPIALVRNLLAFTGIGLFGMVLVGDSFAWIFPIAWSILPFVALPNPEADPTGILVLATQPDDAFAPFAIAVIVWIIGLAFAAGLPNKRS